MGLIVDASVALKWVLQEPFSDEAEALLAHDLAAPAYWLVECASVLSRKARLGQLGPEQARRNLDLLRQAGVRLVETADLLDPALGLSLDLAHPIYDCLYLAHAIVERSTLVTSDVEFHERVAHRRPDLAGRVRLLGAERTPNSR